MNRVIILSGPNMCEGILSKLSDNDFESVVAEAPADPWSWILYKHSEFVSGQASSANGKTREVRKRSCSI